MSRRCMMMRGTFVEDIRKINLVRRRLGSPLPPVIFFGSLIVVFGVTRTTGFFLSEDNFRSILNNGAILAMLACRF